MIVCCLHTVHYRVDGDVGTTSAYNYNATSTPLVSSVTSFHLKGCSVISSIDGTRLPGFS